MGCQEVSLTLSMILLGRKTNFKQADGSSIYIVNHQDAHIPCMMSLPMNGNRAWVPVWVPWYLGSWYLSTQGTCLDTWVTGYLVPKYLWYLSTQGICLDTGVTGYLVPKNLWYLF